MVTNSEDIGNKLHELQCGPYGCSHQTIAPLSDLQSALGLSQLERFPEFISKRKALLDRYKHLSDELQLELTTSKSSICHSDLLLSIMAIFQISTENGVFWYKCEARCRLLA